jgi:hypothetical protein
MGVAHALDYLVNDSLLAGNFSAIGFIGNTAWVSVAIGAAVALHKANTGKWAVIAAALSSILVVHTAPAAIGLVALAIAAALRERQRTHSETVTGRAPLATA